MKHFRVIFSSGALTDLKTIRRWYNQKQAGLGKQMVDDVEFSISSIELNPYYGSIKYKIIRTVACSKFPYAIHYSIDESRDAVIIAAVFHLHRNPFWDRDDA